MSQIGFYYDQTRCAGCKTCQVACKDKNGLGVGTVLREVRSYQVGSYPKATLYHYSATCNHCENPACVKACPVRAMQKDPDDGTVFNDHGLCIGCGSCVQACPYGVPRLDAQTGWSWKCDGCRTLRAEGYEPACVEACPYRALEFGDVDELRAAHPDGTVTELAAQGVGATGPQTLIRPKASALQELGQQVVL